MRATELPDLLDHLDRHALRAAANLRRREPGPRRLDRAPLLRDLDPHGRHDGHDER